MSISKRRLFFDLETSVSTFWAWRTGKQYLGANQILTHTKIISAHWKWEHEDEVHHVHWGLNKQCDKRVLKALLKQLDKADEIVAHNGAKFDIKWVRSRAMFHGLEMRPKYNMVDTYKMVKSMANLPSYSLKECCKYYGLPSKIDAGGVDTWLNIQFKKCQESFNHLLYYGDGDITSLEALYNKLRPYSNNNTHYAALKGLGRFCCPECGNAKVQINKSYTTAAGTKLHYMRCSDNACRTPFKINNKTLMELYDYRIIHGI